MNLLNKISQIYKRWRARVTLESNGICPKHGVQCLDSAFYSHKHSWHCPACESHNINYLMGVTAERKRHRLTQIAKAKDVLGFN